MSTLPKNSITPEQYLEIERQAEFKHEYYNGQMFAMSGAREGHNIIVGNLVSRLKELLRGRGCRVYSNDMRVRVSATGLYTYSDVIVVCGERQFLDSRRDTLLNPTVIFEVLSESTERYDRGRKFDHYGTIGPLCEYVLVASDRLSVEVFSRQPDGNWLLRKALHADDSIDLKYINCRLPVAEMYDEVEFDPEPSR